MDLTSLFNLRNEFLQDIILNPKQIVEELDKVIIGQQEAKKVLALAMFNRAIRLLQQSNTIHLDRKLEKQNVLLIGPTGCGKTSLIRALAEIMDVCLTVVDLTGVTSAGYVGGDVEDLLVAHLNNAKEYIKDRQTEFYSTASNPTIDARADEIASRGILYIDEFDKCRKASPGSSGRDTNGAAVQQELLSILEGGTFRDGRGNTYDVSNLLVICGGAFVGLEEVILERLNKKTSVGFGGNLKELIETKENIFSECTTEDLITYGFLPEIVGRLPLISSLKHLTEQDLVNILSSIDDSLIAEQQSLFKLFGVDLTFETSAIKAIAKEALKLKTGARGLRSILHQVMEDWQYNMYSLDPTLPLTINKNDIKKALER